MRRFAALTASAVLLVGLSPAATASAEPVACKRAINTGSAKFVQGKLKLLQKCNAAVVAQKKSGPCPDAGKTAPKLARARDKCGQGIPCGTTNVCVACTICL